MAAFLLYIYFQIVHRRCSFAYIATTNCRTSESQTPLQPYCVFSSWLEYIPRTVSLQTTQSSRVSYGCGGSVITHELDLSRVQNESTTPRPRTG